MSLENLIIERLPHRPYCTNNLENGLAIRPAKDAAQYAYLQLNPPVCRHWLIFDIDRDYGGFAWESADLPPPNWLSTNRRNGHAHLAYLLEVPVITSTEGRDSPLKYAAALEFAYSLRLRSDPAYIGLISKNPLHDAWKNALLHEHAYSLGELAEWVDLPKFRTSVLRETGLGRNVALFEMLRQWSYKWVLVAKRTGVTRDDWYGSVLQEALKMNAQNDPPLMFSEVKATAKSVTKWTWREFSEAEFKSIQSARGRRSGEARRKGSAEELQPWKREGISRSTYYKRKAEAAARTGTISDTSSTEE